MNVTLQDSCSLEEVDLSALYFATQEESGQNVSTVFRCARESFDILLHLFTLFFLLQRAMAALPRLQALNAFVTVTAETTPLSDLTEEYFKQFSAILVTDCAEVGGFGVTAEHGFLYVHLTLTQASTSRLALCRSLRRFVLTK